MENVNNNNESGIDLVIPGLNQIYYVNKDVLTYQRLKTFLVEMIPNNNYRNFFNNNFIGIENDLPQRTYDNYKNQLSDTFQNLTVQTIIDMIPNDDFINQFTLFSYESISQFKVNTNPSYNLIIYNDEFLYLFIDEIIITKLLSINGNPRNVTFNYYILSELQSQQPRVFQANNIPIICSYHIYTLQYFYKEFKSWNVILNTYSFYKNVQLEMIGENYKIKCKIEDYFINNKKDIYSLSPYLIKEDIHFIADNFIQLKFYYDLIFRYKTFENLNVYLITTLQPKIVLVLKNPLYSRETFLHQQNYLINDSLLYRSFINITNNLYLNGIISHWLISNINDIEEYNTYEDLLTNKILQYVQIHKCKMVNNLKNIQYFLDKQRIEAYLDLFRWTNAAREITERARMNLQIMESFEITLNELQENQGLFEQKLNNLGIDYPVIMKYKDENRRDKIVLLYNRNNYNQYFNQQRQGNFTYQVARFINHEGFMIKAYHFGHDRNSFVFKESIVDINDNENNQYFECLASYIHSRQYIESTRNNRNIDNFTNNHQMRQFLRDIMNLFGQYSGMNVYCLNLLKNDNIFFISNCILLPTFNQNELNNMRQLLLAQNPNIQMPYENDNDFL